MSVEAESQVSRLLEFLSHPLVSSIFRTHPNDLCSRLPLRLVKEKPGDLELVPGPDEWRSWWGWAGECADRWKTLVKMSEEVCSFGRSFNTGIDATSSTIAPSQTDISEELCNLISDAGCLSLPRYSEIMPLFEADQLLKSADAEYRCPGLSFSPLGMSPKKYHEVSRMTTYVLELMERVSGSTGISVQHIVDIGAGQGYLSRSLCSSLKAHVLALDSSPHQTEVAARRFQQTDAASSERKEKGKGTSSKRSDPTTISDSTSVSGGSLNFRTMWLGEETTFQNHPGNADFSTKSGYMVADLEQTIGDWLSDCGTEEERNAANDLGRPTPIILVALHACGSLTPTIFRKLFDLRQEKYSGSGNKTFKPRPWFVAAAVIVGCCYNLIEKDDLHLSSFVKTQIKEQHISFTLTPSHLQLAAQVPSQWLRTPEKTSATELAVKKVLYRALVTPCLQQAMDSRSETGPALPRLGKLNSKAYESFGVFLHYASQKIGVDFVGQYTEDNSDLETVCSTPLARRIETIHAMRCLLGPPVESLIVLDRLLWIQESLREEANSYPMGVQLVNLFDQGVDSGRNIGIVLYPQGNLCQS